MESIIQVEKLAKTFGQEHALHSVDFEVKKGEIFGFLGPSGSGKTTTIKILTGQLQPTNGHATIFGEDVSLFKQPKQRKRFGVLSDNSGLYSRLTVYENLKIYCDLYGVHPSKTEEVLANVNLNDAKLKKVSTLSKGMMQRVLLARVMLHEPELLFLDEPTSALDPVNTMHIYKSLRQLNQKGTTIFLTTHDMYEAETLCNRVAFLNDGKIQLCDTPANLKKQFADGTITVTFKDGQQRSLPIGPAGAQPLFDYMEADQIESIYSNEPTLGEIFIQVTGRKLV